MRSRNGYVDQVALASREPERLVLRDSATSVSLSRPAFRAGSSRSRGRANKPTISVYSKVGIAADLYLHTSPAMLRESVGRYDELLERHR